MSEKDRIELLVRRDGIKEARAWVERTLKLYREAIESRTSHASKLLRANAHALSSRWRIGDTKADARASGDALHGHAGAAVLAAQVVAVGVGLNLWAHRGVSGQHVFER